MEEWSTRAARARIGTSGYLIRDGSDSKQLTADAFIDQQPPLSADGRYIVFQSNRAGGRNLWRIDIDGSNLKATHELAMISIRLPFARPMDSSVIFTSLNAQARRTFGRSESMAGSRCS